MFPRHIIPGTLLSAIVVLSPTVPVAHAEVNWDAVAACESGGNWHINTGNGYSGGLQWAPGTWSRWKAPEDPTPAAAASREAQIAAAERLYTVAGTSPWPQCGKHS